MINFLSKHLNLLDKIMSTEDIRVQIVDDTKQKTDTGSWWHKNIKYRKWIPTVVCHFTGLFYSLLKMKNNTTSKANLKKNNRNRRFHLLLQVCKKMLYELNLLWNLFLKKILCSNLCWNLLRSSREEGKKCWNSQRNGRTEGHLSSQVTCSLNKYFYFVKRTVNVKNRSIYSL